MASDSLLTQFGINLGSAPKAPDLSALAAAGDGTEIGAQIDKAMKDYDNLSASTKTVGVQNADNAGTSYAQRLQQQGINPTAAGVVAAQTKLPLYAQLASIEKDKQGLALDSKIKAQSLAAQVQSTMAQINLGYAQTLADFNIHSAQVQMSAAQLASENTNSAADRALKQQGLDLQGKQLANDTRKTDADIAASSAATTGQNQKNILGGIQVRNALNTSGSSSGGSKLISWMPQIGRMPIVDPTGTHYVG